MSTKVTNLIFILILFYSFSAYANDVEVISLGSNCIVGRVLKEHKIRNHAYPFDWLVSPFPALYQTLDEDFSNFFIKENLIIGPVMGVIDKYSDLQYYHDFPVKGFSLDGLYNETLPVIGKTVDNFLDYYDLVKAKYTRRIARFNGILNSSKPICFIRYSMSQEEAVLLRDFFLSKYPQLDFKLVVVNASDLPTSSWGEFKIINFNIVNEKLADPLSAEWDEVLRNLDLIE